MVNGPRCPRSLRFAMMPSMRSLGSPVPVLALASMVLILGSEHPAFAGKLDRRIAKFAHLVKEDRSFKIRALAAKKLGELAQAGARGDRRIVSALIACLEDDNGIVRGMCVRALSRHRALSAVGRLTYVARFDPEDAVKNAAEDAIAELKRQASLHRRRPKHRPRKRGPVTVAVGRVDVEDSPNLSRQIANLLRQTVRDAVEDQIEPHKPAIFPREDPDLRLDVTIARKVADGSGDLQVEVRVVLMQMPEAHLRHASRALARTKQGRAHASVALEKKLALKAVSRAVSDALALVYNGG